MRDMERVKRIGRYLVGKLRFFWQQSGELEASSDADWGGDTATRRSVSAGVTMRGGHCLKTWSKKQQAVSLSSAESEVYSAAKTASGGLGWGSKARKGHGNIVWIGCALGCLSNNVLGQPDSGP